MAMTNAERQARLQARRKQALVEQSVTAAPKPPPLPPSVSKARKNQFAVGRDETGQLVQRKPPARQVVVDLEPATKIFSARMRDARIAAGLSQAEVVFALFGHDTPTKTHWKRYQNWEIGRSFMTQNYIVPFAKLVGVDCNFLLSMGS